jgi:hypothetical protein
MKKMMQSIGSMVLAGFLMLPSLLSCVASVTPHENFKSLMSHNVGSALDNPNVVGSTNPAYLMESKLLPNGNIENKYRGRDTCRIFFEFNPKTRIIVGWRYEGSDRDCVISPV